MPWWSREQLADRLRWLIEDTQLVAERALALDSASGGSAGMPEGEYGTWKNYALALAGEEQVPASMKDRLLVHAVRLPTADDGELAEGRETTLRLWEMFHGGSIAVVPWVHPSEPHRMQGLALRYRLCDAEDEALRVQTGYGDVRRNERRARL
jgi:hypothetical protein